MAEDDLSQELELLFLFSSAVCLGLTAAKGLIAAVRSGCFVCVAVAFGVVSCPFRNSCAFAACMRNIISVCLRCVVLLFLFLLLLLLVVFDL